MLAKRMLFIGILETVTMFFLVYFKIDERLDAWASTSDRPRRSPFAVSTVFAIEGEKLRADGTILAVRKDDTKATLPI
jgi:hypothetical protein